MCLSSSARKRYVFCALLAVFVCLLILTGFLVKHITQGSFGKISSSLNNLLFQNKCIEDLGCFYTGPPFYDPIYRPISLAPFDHQPTTFALYTPSSVETGEEIEATELSIRNSSIDSRLPVILLIHGYRADLELGDVRFQTKDALLNESGYNIIIVNWSENSGPPYAQAVANARAVGVQVANLLKLIMTIRNVRAQDVHIVGHSLGAHIAGYTGERIPNLGRITGLDPAGPQFQNADASVRLDITDALFVDAIHTDSGENFVEGFGIGDPVGHINFYPNGGRRQPGCFYAADSTSPFGGVINSLFQNRCIEDLDCFYTGPPFYHPLYRPISVPPSKNLSTQFLLYSRMNPDDPQILEPTEQSLGTSTLDPSLDTKILIHGYTVQLDPDDVRFKMKDELLANSPMNVIIVNWTKDNQFPYHQAVANARAVGAQVAKLINYHVENMNLDPKSVHLIGHSLGGQMTGWIGERVPGLGRITGLDPAGPWFQKAPSEVRLDKTDATFIDIIHTNGGNIFVQGLGIDEALGNLDFYPNGGKDQPGCFYEAVRITYGQINIGEFLTREKCIDELGCFNAGSPFFDIVERPLSLLPDDRHVINTTFWLYTPETTTPKVFSNFKESWKSVIDSGYNPHVNTKFVVPGYISSTYSEWKQPLREALLMAEGSNVFFVDWSGGDGLLYEQAVANARVVGAEIALFIQHLQEEVGLKLEDVHVIGHSLGAHIAGYAGKRLNKIARITAMDPAGPFFTGVDPVVRLDRKDAILVDAIHTNAAETRFQGFGLTESIGHFDFYPNGGHLQPGCQDMGHAVLSFLGHLVHFDAEALYDIECNHVRAISLFTSSIRNTDGELRGVVCDSWEDFNSGKCGSCASGNQGTCVPLGMPVNHYTSMILSDRSVNLYLNTTATDPFCR